jgi:hypothetical protein
LKLRVTVDGFDIEHRRKHAFALTTRRMVVIWWSFGGHMREVESARR